VSLRSSDRQGTRAGRGFVDLKIQMAKEQPGGLEHARIIVDDENGVGGRLPRW
jgi:hypothetical protein